MSQSLQTYRGHYQIQDRCGDGKAAAVQDVCAPEMEATMGWNTDFEVSATPRTAIFEVELNVSEFYDLHREPDGDANGITDTSGHIPAGEHRIGFNVTDGMGLSNTTRKQITVTSASNGIAGYIQLPDGEWVVFNGTDSTAYHSTALVNVSWTWNIPYMSPGSGLGEFSRSIDRGIAATLTVIAGSVCTGVSRAEVSMPPTLEDVPILTPAGMIALTRHVVHRRCRAGSQEKAGGHELSP